MPGGRDKMNNAVIKRHDRLAIARFVIDNLAPIVKDSGIAHGAAATQPSCRTLELHELRVMLAQNVLLATDDESTSNLLDIRAASGNKVFSTSWQPLRPWVPPRIICFRSGAWLAVLGYQPSS
jgi:hypothetical protein